MSKLRSGLYRAARGLGHVEAVRRGRVPQRIGNVGLGRAYGRLTGSGCLVPIASLLGGLLAGTVVSVLLH